MQIQDGSGKGYWVKVDQYNRFHVYSTLIREIADVSSISENAFSITTDTLTFNSTNEHPWLYIKNKNPDLYLYLSSILYSYNGGDTNHNRTMIKKVYRNPPEPTDRYDNDCCITNLNMGSNNSSKMDVYVWNGSGDGMEMNLSEVDNVSTSIVGSGTLRLDDLEGVILPYNSSILFTYEPEEVGIASISMKIYFNHAREK